MDKGLMNYVVEAFRKEKRDKKKKVEKRKRVEEEPKRSTIVCSGSDCGLHDGEEGEVVKYCDECNQEHGTRRVVAKKVAECLACGCWYCQECWFKIALYEVQIHKRPPKMLCSGCRIWSSWSEFVKAKKWMEEIKMQATPVNVYFYFV